MTAPPTSADVERLFSTASEISNKRRNRLLPNNAEKLLFVHENIANVNYQW
ncbi:MAG: hAT transposon family protein [Gammaproteobacteria bacterium]|nr:hAT transposon family protein [Gammaproteobacteria bacterium]